MNEGLLDASRTRVRFPAPPLARGPFGGRSLGPGIGVLGCNPMGFQRGACRRTPGSSRGVSKFIAACSAGLVDAALNFIWDELVLRLRIAPPRRKSRACAPAHARDPLAARQHPGRASAAVDRRGADGVLDGAHHLLSYWPQARFLELANKHRATMRAKLKPSQLNKPLCEFAVPAA